VANHCLRLPFQLKISLIWQKGYQTP